MKDAVTFNNFKSFLLWLRLYQNHIVTAIDALIWARRHGLRLPLKDEFSMLKWNSYKRFKETHQNYIAWTQQRPTE